MAMAMNVERPSATPPLHQDPEQDQTAGIDVDRDQAVWEFPEVKNPSAPWQRWGTEKWRGITWTHEICWRMLKKAPFKKKKRILELWILSNPGWITYAENLVVFWTVVLWCCWWCLFQWPSSCPFLGWSARRDALPYVFVPNGGIL